MKTLGATARISLKNILFATDFSSASSGALPYALAIAHQYEAKVYAVHVNTPATYTFVPPASWPAVAEMEEREAQEEAKRLEEQLKGVPHELVFHEGHVWEVLSDIIEKNEIDLLVIGTHGRTGVQKLLLGSVAEEILRLAPCPVLTVGPNISANLEGVVEMREILFATDFSPESLAAAPYAISLAQEHQAQLSLLHVLERVDAAIRDPELSAASLLHRLQALVPTEAELWCRPKYFVNYGSPAAQIVELAKARHADLIVMGVRRAEGHMVAATHLGRATAHNVVSKAECPVLTVRG